MTIITLLCSTKFQSLLGVKLKESLCETQAESPLSVWCADVQQIGPKKIVAFMETESLYPVFAGPTVKSDLRDLKQFFDDTIRSAWCSEKIDTKTIDSVLERFSEVRLLKNGNPSLRGFMNDHVQHMKSIVQRSGGFENTRLIPLGRNLARKPILAKQRGSYPVELLAEILKNKFNWTGRITDLNSIFADSWADEVFEQVNRNDLSFDTILPVPFLGEELELIDLSFPRLILGTARGLQASMPVNYSTLWEICNALDKSYRTEPTLGKKKQQIKALAIKLEPLLESWQFWADYNERYGKNDPILN